MGFQVRTPFMRIKRLVISSEVLNLYTIQLGKSFKVVFTVQGLTNLKRDLAVNVDITRVVIVEQGSTMISIVVLFLTICIWQSTGNL